MNHNNFLIEKNFWKAKVFYDKRSEKIKKIENFLISNSFKNILNSLKEETYITLSWDWLFVYIAKKAHKENKKILWINFWNLGFLVQEKEVFEKENLEFISKKYPLLKIILKIKWEKEKISYVFNEIYVTRTWDASSLELDISHLSKKISSFKWDWIMVSTPAGSTWWSRSYSGIILPHNANLNILTPIWTISPIWLKSIILSDIWRIKIKNCSKRKNSVDILVDNNILAKNEEKSFEIIIERDENFLEVLIEKDNLKKFQAKVYDIQWMCFQN